MLEKPIYVVLDVDTGQTMWSGGDINSRHSPCGTFRIPLAIIGFDSGTLIDDHTPRFEYKPKGQHGTESHDPWKDSCTPGLWLEDKCGWYSQRVTQAIGRERLQAYVDKLYLGNRDLSGDVRDFWVLSSLKISVLEQAVFLRRMLTGELPVSAASIAQAQKFAKPEPCKVGALFGKAAGDYIDPAADYQLGWHLGWIERDGKKYVFATYLECMSAYNAAYLAKEFSRGMLEHKLGGGKEVSQYRKEAEQGDAEAQYIMGRLYGGSHYDVEQDDAESTKWYRLAAEQGHPRAQYMIAWYYLEGSMGFQKDARQALKLFKSSAKQGNGYAMSALGGIYRDGKAVAKNYEKAFYWYGRALLAAERIAAAHGGEARRSDISHLKRMQAQILPHLSPKQIAAVEERISKREEQMSQRKQV